MAITQVSNSLVKQDLTISGGTVDNTVIGSGTPAAGTFTTVAGALASTVTGTTAAASDNSTKIATTAYVTTALANLVDSAPGTLNTLNELAAALGDDASFSTTVTNSIATKAPLAGATFTGDINAPNIKATTEFQIFAGGTDIGAIFNSGGALTIQGTSTRDVSIGSDSSTNSIFIEGSNGNVGIGTTSPAEVLQVAGGIKTTGGFSANTANSIGMSYSSGFGHFISWGADGSTKGAYKFTGSASDGSPTADYMVIDSNGQLLHGTTAVPTGVLLGRQLVSSSATGSEIIAFRADTSVAVGDKTGAFLLGNSDTDGAEDHFVGMYGKVSSTNGSQNLHFVAGRSGYEGDTPDMTLASGGNVGIGTTSPSRAPLHIHQPTSNTDSNIHLTSAVTGSNSGDGFTISVSPGGAGDTSVALIQRQNAEMKFYTHATERMRIDSSGRVGIFNSSPVNYTGAGARSLVVGSNSSASDPHGITIVAGSSSTSNLAFTDNAGSGSANDYRGLFQYAHSDDSLRIFVASAERMRIDSSGNVGIGTAPATKFDVMTAGANQWYIRNSDSSSQENAIVSLRTGGYSNLNLDGTNVVFKKSGVEIARVDDDGIKMASGKGIKFDAYGSNNVLDDYEEGTWTPLLDGSSSVSGQSYTTQQASYTKVGRKVTANFQVLLSNKGTIAGVLRISGLPFGGISSPLYQTATLMAGNLTLGTGQLLKGMQYAANNFIYLMLEESGQSLSQPNTNILNNNTEISGSVTYFTT